MTEKHRTVQGLITLLLLVATGATATTVTYSFTTTGQIYEYYNGIPVPDDERRIADGSVARGSFVYDNTVSGTYVPFAPFTSYPAVTSFSVDWPGGHIAEPTGSATVYNDALPVTADQQTLTDAFFVGPVGSGAYPDRFGQKIVIGPNTYTLMSAAVEWISGSQDLLASDALPPILPLEPAGALFFIRYSNDTVQTGPYAYYAVNFYEAVVTPVPLPSTAGLFGFGVASLGPALRRRRNSTLGSRSAFVPSRPTWWGRRGGAASPG